VEVDAWLGSLHPTLDRQARILRLLTAEAEADLRIRVLVVGCSVGREAADALSDLDVNLSVADESWPAFVEDVAPVLRRLGDVVDVLQHKIGELGDLPHCRFFVQYRCGVQLDLVVQPVSLWKNGRSPDMVVLHDRDHLTDTVTEPSNASATAEEVREWAFLGWEAISNCAKHLARGSHWEALDQLNFARGEVWRLWAVAQGVPQPSYGLTTILDHGISLPSGIEDTVSDISTEGLWEAARACAGLLEDLWPDATAAIEGQSQPLPDFARWVKERLQRGRP
jgi:hypothetical protein